MLTKSSRNHRPHRSRAAFPQQLFRKLRGRHAWHHLLRARGLTLPKRALQEACSLKEVRALTATNKQAKDGFAITRCALSSVGGEPSYALLWLNRNFRTIRCLVLTSMLTPSLARASLQLARTAASSYQAHELNAIARMQGKWDDAAAEYRLMLDKTQIAGIHFRYRA